MRARRPDLTRRLRQGMATMCYTGYLRAKAAGDQREAGVRLRRLLFTMPVSSLRIFVYRPLRQALRRLTAAQPAQVLATGLKFSTIRADENRSG
jgi:hypothetical protein